MESCDGQVLFEAHAAQYPFDQSLWLSKDEWINIRKQVKEATDSVQEGDDIWNQTRQQSYATTMSRVWSQCTNGVELPPSLKAELLFWTSISHSRRGLERFVLCEVRSERRQSRRRHAEALLFVQDQCRYNRINFETSSLLLHVASEKLSEPEVNLAFALAEADADAVAFARELDTHLPLSQHVNLPMRERAQSPSEDSRENAPVANAAA